MSTKTTRRQFLVEATAFGVGLPVLIPTEAPTANLSPASGDNPRLCWNGRPVMLSSIIDPKNDAWLNQANRIRYQLFHTGCYSLYTTTGNEDFDVLEGEARAAFGPLAANLSRDDVICLYGMARIMIEVPMEGSLRDHLDKPKVEPTPPTPEEKKKVIAKILGAMAGVSRKLEAELAEAMEL